MVESRIRGIIGQLTRILFGDYTVTVQLDDADPVWGNLAMHINVAINAARNAISRATESERQASEALEEALAAARAESRFVTNVSHELRTPLASIRAAAEILHNYSDEPPETRVEFSEIILSESERLTRLIDNVLDLGRVQSDHMMWDFRKIHVGDTVSEVIRNFNVARSKHGVVVELRSQPGLPATYCDRDRLKQLWTNLVGNAIKFSGASDRVWVDVTGDETHIHVAVRDEGIGIAPRDREFVFDRFRQVANDTLTNKPHGTGLGLAISKEIVLRHGGSIEIESELDRGSTFHVDLPVSPSGAPLPAASSTRRRPGAAR